MFISSTVQYRSEVHTHVSFLNTKNARERGSLVCMKQSFVSPFVTLNVCQIYDISQCRQAISKMNYCQTLWFKPCKVCYSIT